MKSILVFTTTVLIAMGCRSEHQSGVKDEQGPPLAFHSYEVRFTNPECEEYRYEEPVLSNGGDLLEAKPKNVYCKSRDSYASGRRETSPQYKIIEWIRDTSTRHIALHSLSFSNSLILRELCTAVEQRNVRIDLVLDRNTDLSKANELLACQPASGTDEDKPKLHVRGHEGGITYAHNKLIMVNLFEDSAKIAFSSANLSSGVVLHHENWHFVELNSASFFVEAHRCLHNGVLENGSSARRFSDYVADCKSRIRFPEERDVKTFFIPGEGSAATSTIVDALESSDRVRIAAHRFSYYRLLNALERRLESRGFSADLVVDDDLYWAGRGQGVGPNTTGEARDVEDLRRAGMNVRYMETNHDARLLHHNKYIVFESDTGNEAVFAGAGNFTTAAFTDNYENFYFITVPTVVEAFKAQYDHVWEDLATQYADLPRENVLP